MVGYCEATICENVTRELNNIPPVVLYISYVMKSFHYVRSKSGLIVLPDSAFLSSLSSHE